MASNGQVSPSNDLNKLEANANQLLDDRDHNVGADFGFCSYFLIAVSYFLSVVCFPFSLCTNIKIVQEYERAVIFRLGRILPGGAKGPGLFFILPCIDSYSKVDLRVVSFQVPPQEVLTKDSVTVEVDAVVYYRVRNATVSITNVENYKMSTQLLAQTSLRNILGTKTLTELLADREHISQQMQNVLDAATEEWGVKVERVEVKDVRIPQSLQRALAAEAEAQREAKAKVIAAEGEEQASQALRQAALVMADTPAALQLRYLQTLNTISADNASTIVFPIPMDLMNIFKSSVQPQLVQPSPQPLPPSTGYNRHGENISLAKRLMSLEREFDEINSKPGTAETAIFSANH